ncbi:MAG: hypothetical protein ACOCVF_03080 [bacterium]
MDFIEFEQTGRKLLYDYLNYMNKDKGCEYKYVIQTDKFSIYDVDIQTKDHHYITEIKYRQNSSKEYKEDIIELNKYIGLYNEKREMEQKTDKKVTMLYVIFYLDYYVRIYNLNKLKDINYRIVDYYNNVTTADNQSKRKKRKQNILLDTNNAIINRDLPNMYNNKSKNNKYEENN